MKVRTDVSGQSRGRIPITASKTARNLDKSLCSHPGEYHISGGTVKKFSLTALLCAIVFASMALPGHVAASECCPGSGCCGPNQAFSGQQLFTVPYGQPQASPAWTGNQPQGTELTNVSPTPKKTQASQTRTKPVVHVAPQAARPPTRARAFLLGPLQETLW